MQLVALLACVERPTPPDTPAGIPPGGPSAALVELVLDRGSFDDGEWVSEPVGDDTLAGATLEPGQGTLARGWLPLAPGPGVARIRRACGVVEVPYVVSTDQHTVLLPYPGCAIPDAPVAAGVRLDRHEVAWRDVARVQALGVPFDVPPPPPGEEGGPARWIPLAEARAWCAWWGGRLPTEAEWTAALAGASGVAIGPREAERTGGPLGPEERATMGLIARVSATGHQDVDGNVEEWLADGRVAGGGWLGLPAWLGRVREVPAIARSEGIGVRCAYDAQ